MGLNSLPGLPPMQPVAQPPMNPPPQGGPIVPLLPAPVNPQDMPQPAQHPAREAHFGCSKTPSFAGRDTVSFRGNANSLVGAALPPAPHGPGVQPPAQGPNQQNAQPVGNQAGVQQPPVNPQPVVQPQPDANPNPPQHQPALFAGRGTLISAIKKLLGKN